MTSVTPDITAPAMPEVSNSAECADDRIDAADDCSRKPDRAPALPASASLCCLQAFALTALAGAVIALVAPLTFVRVLGLVAFGAGMLGVLLHAYLLRHDHPVAWNGWFVAQQARIDRLRAGWSHEHSSAPVHSVSGAHGLARFAPAMAREN